MARDTLVSCVVVFFAAMATKTKKKNKKPAKRSAAPKLAAGKSRGTAKPAKTERAGGADPKRVAAILAKLFDDSFGAMHGRAREPGGGDAL
jgi:hypothetical protein